MIGLAHTTRVRDFASAQMADTDQQRDNWVAHVNQTMRHLRRVEKRRAERESGRRRSRRAASSSDESDSDDSSIGGTQLPADAPEGTALALALHQVERSRHGVRVVVPESVAMPLQAGKGGAGPAGAASPTEGDLSTPKAGRSRTIGLPRFKARDRDCDLTSAELRAKYVDPLPPPAETAVPPPAPPQPESKSKLSLGLQSLTGRGRQSSSAPRRAIPPVTPAFFETPCVDPPPGTAATPYGARQPMRQTLRERYRRALTEAQGARDGPFVLIVDQVAKRSISSVLRNSDLQDMGYMVVESLERSRQNVPLHAVYLLSPDFVATDVAHVAAAVKKAGRSSSTCDEKSEERKGGEGGSDDSDHVSDSDSDGPAELRRKRRASIKARKRLAKEKAAAEATDGSGGDGGGGDGEIHFDADPSLPDVPMLDPAVGMLYSTASQQRTIVTAGRRLPGRPKHSNGAAVSLLTRDSDGSDAGRNGRWLAPTSLDRCIADFTGRKAGRSPPQKKMYGSAVVVMISEPSDAALLVMRRTIDLGGWLQRALIADMEVVPVESRAFSLDMPSSLVPLYCDRAALLQMDRLTTLKLIAGRLVSLFSALNEYPYIRFGSGDPVLSQLASMLQMMLDDHVRNNRAFWYHGMMDVRRRGTLTLFSRVADLAAPLLHDFSYQSTVYEAFDVPPGAPIKLGSSSGKVTELRLDETDPMWVEHRHSHVSIAVQVINEHLLTLASSDAARLERDKSILSMDELSSAISGLRLYLRSKRRTGTHAHLAEECYRTIMRRHWFEVADAEQTIVTGVTDSGSTIKPSKLLQKVEEAMDHANGDDKLRLVALYMMFLGGLDEAEQHALVDQLSGPQQDALLAFAKLGVPTGRAGKPLKRHKREVKAAQAAARNCKTRLEQLSRVQPKLAGVMRELVEGDLGTDEFPYVMEPPPSPEDLASFGQALDGSAAPTSAAPADTAAAGGAGGASHAVQSRRSSLSKFGARTGNDAPGGKDDSSSGSNSDSDSDSEPPRHRRQNSGRVVSRFDTEDAGGIEEDLNPTKPRQFVFVVGGMTMSEMAAAYHIGREAQTDLILGSTHVLTPQSFLRDVSLLEPEDL